MLLMAREALREQAMRDGLTGLWNRNAIFSFFDRELARAERERAPLAIMMIDLDHFKQINDTQGHLAGDAVLQEVARRLCACVRPYDGVGRYGGEELLLVAPGADMETAISLAERVRVAIEQTTVAIQDGEISVSCSIGVAVAGGGRAASDDLLRSADEALYAAKQRGRNRIETGVWREP